MSRDEPIDRALPGKTVTVAHQSNGHGDVLYLDFQDGTQLVVWAFDRPDNQQLVLWNPDSGELLQDLRSPDCRQYTEQVFRKLEARTPPARRPGDAPFKTYHHSHFVPD